MTNLQMLQEAEKDMQLKDARSMEDYFIGVLSVLVDESTWKRALIAAVESRKRVHTLTPIKETPCA